MIAAGNRETDKGVTYRMPLSLENRFVRFELRVDSPRLVELAVMHDVNRDVVGYPLLLKVIYNFDRQPCPRGFATPMA